MWPNVVTSNLLRHHALETGAHTKRSPVFDKLMHTNGQPLVKRSNSFLPMFVVVQGKQALVVASLGFVELYLLPSSNSGFDLVGGGALSLMAKYLTISSLVCLKCFSSYVVDTLAIYFFISKGFNFYLVQSPMAIVIDAKCYHRLSNLS
ncbi:hypothetical protein AXF42_Ash004066 [Apostasia shenzhenica]|uniref:Uncharacterized protein n=1 Tax=Apostasia shenzhenica TaxID=1088818 RepID=A0A2I0A1V5_9ASPA|nr:hypothetical protein AXF42_Ash004066 [Apostasia shenzhenica]